MKGLPPSLRRKKRYIAFKIITDDKNIKIESKNLIRNIWDTTLSLFGELHSNAGLRLEYFNGEYGILRCSRNRVEDVLAVLTLITSIGERRVVIKTLGVSGTIKGCKKFLNNTQSQK